MHEVCCNNGKSFIDKEFLPSITSLFKPSTELSEGEMSGAEPTKRSSVVWRRASDFLEGDYAVFDEGIGPADIRQGALGDCWFLCAIAALAEFPLLVEQIVETKEVNGDGCYRMKFCKNGQWQSVRVDDYFPCYPAAGPVYSKSNGDELWVMLLEKAFAKLHGSYEAIKGGLSYEAMTCAPYRRIRFKDLSSPEEDSDDEDYEQLWKDLLAYDAQNYVMSASTPGEDTFTETGILPGKDGNGLVAGHAYTLIAAKESGEGHRLLKLRNPWGSLDWNGDWSDTSPLWTEALMEEMGRVEADDVDTNDGLFWMSFEDLMKNFDAINVCMVRCEGLHPTPWIERRSRFHYKLDQDSGAVSVSTFLLEVEEDGEFIVGVHQTDKRCQSAKPYMDIGVTVMKEDDEEEGKYSFVAGSGNTVDRQNSTNTIELSAGKYLVIPTTTGLKLKQQLAEGSVEEEAAAIVTEDAAGNKVFTQPVLQVYSEIFDRFDRDNDGYLSQADMSECAVVILDEELEEEAFQLLMEKFESGEDAPGLSKAAFLNAVQASFVAGGADEDKMRSGLSKLGYDASLCVESGRSAVLSVHGTTPYTLETKEFNEDIYEEAVELPIIKNGKMETHSHGNIKLYKLKAGYYGVSWVVENVNDRPLLFELDVTGSKNVISNRGDFKFEQIIEPGEAKVMHHIMPDAYSSWSYKWDYCYAWKD